jgi:hypothetical protein
VLDLRKQTLFSNNAQKVLKVRDFYAATRNDGGTDHRVETELLNEIESRAKPVIDTVISSSYPPAGQGWEDLAIFVASEDSILPAVTLGNATIPEQV